MKITKETMVAMIGNDGVIDGGGTNGSVTVCGMKVGSMLNGDHNI